MASHSTQVDAAHQPPAGLEVVPRPYEHLREKQSLSPEHNAWTPQDPNWPAPGNQFAQYHKGYYTEKNTQSLLEPPTQPESHGIRRITLILAVLLTAVIVGGAVGGGVGGTMGKHLENARLECRNTLASVPIPTPAPTPSPTTTGPSDPSDRAYVPLQNVTLALDCPAIDSSDMEVRAGSFMGHFTPLCGIDYVDGAVDVAIVLVYSFKDCLAACLSMNKKQRLCIAVEFNTDLPQLVAMHGGTCFLKSQIKDPVDKKSNKLAAALLRE